MDNINLDITDHEFDSNGINNFKWPINIFSIDSFRDNILRDLIPVLKNNKDLSEDESIKKPLNILFKWFILDILNIYKACEIKNVFEDKKIRIFSPERFSLLNSILKNKCPPTIFDTFKNGPVEKFQTIKILKKIYRFFQLNSFTDIASLNFSETIAVQYSNEVSKLLKNNGEINFFKNFSDYFKIKVENLTDENNLDLSKKNIEELNEILNIIKNNFENKNINFSNNIKDHFKKFILDCNFFIRIHKEKINSLPKKIVIGSTGGQVWGKMLCNFVIQSGGHVTGVEHGRGDILHDFLPKNFVDFDDVSKFICLNKQHADMNLKKYQSSKHLHLSKKLCSIEFPSKNIDNPFKLNKPKLTNKKKKETMTGMYVSTAYMGYGGRLRSTLPDIVYYDFQIKLLSDLMKLNKEILCKPHPEGRSKVGDLFYNKFNCKKIDISYDEAIKKYEFDFFITDHIASTTMVDMILSIKPTILMNFGTPKINNEIKEELYKSIYVIDVDFDNHNRACYDVDKLKDVLLEIEQNKQYSKPISKYYS